MRRRLASGNRKRARRQHPRHPALSQPAAGVIAPPQGRSNLPDSAVLAPHRNPITIRRPHALGWFEFADLECRASLPYNTVGMVRGTLDEHSEIEIAIRD